MARNPGNRTSSLLFLDDSGYGDFYRLDPAYETPHVERSGIGGDAPGTGLRAAGDLFGIPFGAVERRRGGYPGRTKAVWRAHRGSDRIQSSPPWRRSSKELAMRRLTFGKWHCGDTRDPSLARGFDEHGGLMRGEWRSVQLIITEIWRGNRDVIRQRDGPPSFAQGYGGVPTGPSGGSDREQPDGEQERRSRTSRCEEHPEALPTGPPGGRSLPH